jgi:hypothetical protein
MSCVGGGGGDPLEIEGYSIHQSRVDKPIMLLVCNVLIVNDIEKKITLKTSKFRTLLQTNALFVKNLSGRLVDKV